MADNNTYLTIRVLEDGTIHSVMARTGTLLKASRNLDKSLSLGNNPIKTIVLIKLIKPDNSYTWLIKYPPEPDCFPCARCRCAGPLALNEESLWIKPEDSAISKDSAYLTLQISEGGEIQSVMVRNKTLDTSESLLVKPLNLGDLAIGEFNTITLLKLTRPDNSYTWVVKHPPCEPDNVSQDAILSKYTGVQVSDDESLWIKLKDSAK